MFIIHFVKNQKKIMLLIMADTAGQNYLLCDRDNIPRHCGDEARLPVDEPALASIMTDDHAKDLCASELVLLKI